MSKKPDGGPAFHCPATGRQNGDSSMSLRDWFAGQALVGNLAYSWHNPMSGNFQENCSVENLAAVCYGIADAMLAERNK